MRRAGRGLLALGLLLGLAACANDGVDTEDATVMAAKGAVWGAALGTGIGAAVALNPAVGTVMGAATGAFIGVASGVIFAQPEIEYAPIALPKEAVIPGFYDTWAPGTHPPPIGAMTPPPRAGGAG